MKEVTKWMTLEHKLTMDLASEIFQTISLPRMIWGVDSSLKEEDYSKIEEIYNSNEDYKKHIPLKELEYYKQKCTQTET